uniref:Glycosyl transferase family 2 n=1 Tax=Cyanothece sp. (strain PCC 7425 / ATCC 29141) TaxID=395961 RepID=B8HRB1_CYAP4
MATKSLVSGIIIFLNCEKYIEEAIASVFTQTYPHWELLLVDDGSTDGSTAIAQRYAQQYPEQVFYLEHAGHQNRGMSASRNLGIAHARGDYLAFLDADDVWLPQKLEQQLNLFQHYPEAGVVCGPTLWWYSWTGHPYHQALDAMREMNREYDRLFQPPTLLKQLLLDQARTPATCSVLIKRELLRETGGFEEEFRALYEDQAFFAKVYLKAKVYISSQHWDLYRQHSENCCVVADKTGQGTPGLLNPAHQRLLQWLEQYLLAENVQDAELIKLLSTALWAYDHPQLYYMLHPERLARIIGRALLPTQWREWLWNRYMTIKGMSLNG